MPRIILMLLFALSWPAKATRLTAYTEDVPPLNYAVGDDIRGYASELLDLIAKEAGLEVSKELMPWARAYRVVQEKPDFLLYSIVRTAEREGLFRWIGPIGPRHIYMFGLSQRNDINVSKESDLLQYRYGATFESAAARKLAAIGLPNYNPPDLAKNDETNLKKLLHGRTDLIAMLDWAMIWQLKQQGLPQDTVRKVWLLDGGKQYWFAINRKTSPETIARLQSALDKLTANGTVRKLQTRHFGN